MHRLFYFLKYDVWYKFINKCQRFNKGYADVDVWNINTWFLDIMPKMLDQLKHNHVGYHPDLSPEEWEQELEKMRQCFLEANEDTCSMINPYEEAFEKMYIDFNNQFGIGGEKLLKDTDKTDTCIRCYLPSDPEVGNKEWQELSENYNNEFTKICKYRDDKLHEGLDLFSKYFWHLWD